MSANLEPSTYLTICACEHTVVLIMRSAGVYSAYTPRRIVGTVFWQSETACSKKKREKSFTALDQVLRNATMMNSNFSSRNSAMMRTTRTKYAAGLPAAPKTISILFFCLQCNRILHFLRIADTDFDVVDCLDRLVGLLGVRHKFVSSSLTFSLCCGTFCLGTGVEVIVFHH